MSTACACPLAADDETVLEERRRGRRFEDHQSRIANRHDSCRCRRPDVSLEDFDRRQGAGVVVAAATTPDAAVARAREIEPSLVISTSTAGGPQPFEVLRRLRDDPELRGLPTLGFVSHVHADLVRQARALGIGEVLARSAFVARCRRFWRRMPRPYASPDAHRGTSAPATSSPRGDACALTSSRRRSCHSPWLSAVDRRDGAPQARVAPTDATRSRSAARSTPPCKRRGTRPATPPRTIVTASAGNHGRAMALAAEQLGLTAVVFTPAHGARNEEGGHPAARRRAARRASRITTRPKRRARDSREPRARLYISPYNHPDVIAGAATIGARDARSAAGVRRAGRAARRRRAGQRDRPGAQGRGAARQRRRRRGRGVDAVRREPGARPHHRRSIRARRSPMDSPAISNPARSPSTSSPVSRSRGRRERRGLGRAIRGLAAEEHLIAEGAGAAATAAVIAGNAVEPGQRAVVMVTGGNIELESLRASLSRSEGPADSVG